MKCTHNEDCWHKFMYKKIMVDSDIELSFTQWRYLIDTTESLLAEQKKELMEEERQFILNILDGIDIADKQMGVIGGTQAIRQALQSRVI